MSDCLITGVQVDSEDVAERTASTVFVTFSRPVQPGLLVTVNGELQTFPQRTLQLACQGMLTRCSTVVLAALACLPDSRVKLCMCCKLA